jgi:hypothetical protein
MLKKPGFAISGFPVFFVFLFHENPAENTALPEVKIFPHRNLLFGLVGFF